MLQSLPHVMFLSDSLPVYNYITCKYVVCAPPLELHPVHPLVSDNVLNASYGIVCMIEVHYGTASLSHT